LGFGNGAGDKPTMKFHERAAELRADATDHAIRERLLKLADACEETARWKPHKSEER